MKADYKTFGLHNQLLSKLGGLEGYTVFEAIEMTARAGGRVIELYPGQALGKGENGEKFNHETSDELINRVKKHITDHDLILVNYGVVGLPNNRTELRKIFEFAKKLGVKAITSEPSPEAMELIEEMVKEYDIAMAIDNHPPRKNNDNYKHWNPEFVLSMVEERKPRIGISSDIGHYIRSGIDPVDTLQLLEGRIISLHFTDVTEWGSQGKDTVAGTGVANLSAVLNELKRQKFGGNISIEFETNWNDNITDVARFIGYIKGWADANNF